MLVAGSNVDQSLVEIIELPEHPWFVAVQFHPEFKSKPTAAHPLFAGFIGRVASRRRARQDNGWRRRGMREGCRLQTTDYRMRGGCWLIFRHVLGARRSREGTKPKNVPDPLLNCQQAEFSNERAIGRRAKDFCR